jgi:hypothetical protein
MGNPYLNRDESIILTTHNVNFNNVVTEVIFTNQRLILFDSRHPQFRYQTIPLTTIETVVIREDAQDNPVIFLQISPIAPDSPPQSRELTFSRQTSGDRKRECEEWVKQLKEQIASIRRQASLPPQPVSHQDTDIIFEDIGTSGTEQVPAAETLPAQGTGPGEPLVNSPLAWREADIGSTAVLPDTGIPADPEEESLVQDIPKSMEEGPVSESSPPPPAQPSNPKLIAVTAIVIIVALVAGAFIYASVLQGNTGEPMVPPVTTIITTAATVIPTPIITETPVPQITLTPTPRPTAMIPDKGVWVKIQYAGNFTGRVGTSGNLKEVNASGDQYYQIPINDGIVEVLVQKEDGSGNVLTVEIYQNGRLVNHSTKATPFGAVEVRETIKRG